MPPASLTIFMASRKSGSLRSKFPYDMKNFSDVWPASCSGTMLSRLFSVGLSSTGCMKKSTIDSDCASATSRAMPSAIVSSLSGKLMLPTVVMPPAAAARLPDSKSSDQLTSRERRLGGVRCTCASTPPGVTIRPDASISRGGRHRSAHLHDTAIPDADIDQGRTARRHRLGIAQDQIHRRLSLRPFELFNGLFHLTIRQPVADLVAERIHRGDEAVVA